jgi:hypothetical protein
VSGSFYIFSTGKSLSYLQIACIIMTSKAARAGLATYGVQALALHIFHIFHIAWKRILFGWRSQLSWL